MCCFKCWANLEESIFWTWLDSGQSTNQKKAASRDRKNMIHSNAAPVLHESQPYDYSSSMVRNFVIPQLDLVLVVFLSNWFKILSCHKYSERGHIDRACNSKPQIDNIMKPADNRDYLRFKILFTELLFLQTKERRQVDLEKLALSLCGIYRREISMPIIPIDHGINIR